MLNSKTNRIVLIVSAFFVIALVLYALLRDTADLATFNEAKTMLESGQVEKVTATEDYVYLQTPHGKFKIATSETTPELFVNHKVKVGSGSNVIVVLLILVLLLGIGSILFRYRLKRDESSKPVQQVSAASPDMSNPGIVTPVKSDVTFADIGGISDVKEELEPWRRRLMCLFITRAVPLLCISMSVWVQSGCMNFSVQQNRTRLRSFL